MIILYFFIFVISILALAASSKWIVGSLTNVARFFGWREFVFAFFIMAVAGSLPNLFIGISSVLQGVPILSLGEVLGGDIVDLTIAIGLAAIISKNGLTVQSRTVQGTAVFTLIAAILPLLLIQDYFLSRVDGIILLLAFVIYMVWLFAKAERFTRVYDDKPILGLKEIFKNLFILVGSVTVLFLAADGVVRTATFFAESLNLPLILIGILIVGMSNALPEIFFGIQAAKRGDDWMVVGGFMGAVIGAATLVLGIVALLSPFALSPTDVSLLLVVRVFLIIASVFFLLFIRSSHKITRREGLFLLALYLFFVLAQILVI